MARKPAGSTGSKSTGRKRTRKKAESTPEAENAAAAESDEAAEAAAPPRKTRRRSTKSAASSAGTKRKAGSPTSSRSRKKKAEPDGAGTEPAPKPKRSRKRATAAKTETPEATEAPAKPKRASRARKPATADKQAEVVADKPAAAKTPAKAKGRVTPPKKPTRKEPQATVKAVAKVAGSVTVKQRSNLYTQRIDQIGAAYSMIEDRVLINISRKDRSGVKVWLTRRATNHLWHAMMKVIEKRPDIASQKTTVTKKAVMEFQQTSAVQTNDPKKPFRKEDLMYPHGEDPLLVHSFTCGPDPDGLLQVTLRFGKEREFVTSLDLRMVYLFSDLLKSSANKMDWGLTLDVNDRPKEVEGTPAEKPVVH